MFRPKKSITTAANGHLRLNWPDSGPLFFSLLCWKLRLRYGLRPSGRELVAYPDVIFPNLVGRGTRLLAGWDNWSGYYLLAEDEAGDEILKQLAGGSQPPG